MEILHRNCLRADVSYFLTKEIGDVCTQATQEGINKEARLTHSICLQKIDCIPLVDFLSFFVKKKSCIRQKQEKEKK